MLPSGRKLQGIWGGSAGPQIFSPLMIDYRRQGRSPFERLVATFPFEDSAAAWHACESSVVIKPVPLLEPA